MARCAASYLWKSFNEAFDVIGKRSVYGMDFQLEFGFYSTPALPRSVCCPVVALQQNPELLLKLPSSVPLDLLFLRIFVCGVCAYFRFFSTRVSPALRLLQSVEFFSA